MPPVNDNFVDAIEITGASGSIAGDNTGATLQLFSGSWEQDISGWYGSYGPLLGFGGGRSVWYKWTCPVNGTYIFTTGDDGGSPIGDTILTIVKGFDIDSAVDPDLEIIDQDDDGAGVGFYSKIELVATAGVEYHISVDGYNGTSTSDGGYNVNDTAEGGFLLSWSVFIAPPPNDLFQNAEELAYQYKVCVTGTTEGATSQGINEDASEPNTFPGDIDPPYPSVWYKYFNPNWAIGPLDIQFDTEGSDVGTDTYLEVFEGTNIVSMTRVGSDHNSGAGGKSLIVLTAQEGDTGYMIRVSSPSTDWGSFKLNITILVPGTPPANDDFDDAIEMTGYSDSVTGTTEGATGECQDSEGYNSVWYKWTPPQSGRLKIRLDADDQSSFNDLILSIFRGTSLADLVQVGIDLFIDENDFDNEFYFIENGYEYFFRIQGDGGFEDTFTFAFELPTSSPPSNDEPSGADSISLSPLTGTLTPVSINSLPDTVGPWAANYTDKANEEQTVWYKYVAPKDGLVTFNFISADNAWDAPGTVDGLLGFYKGADITTAVEHGTMIAVPANPFLGDESTFSLFEGETFWVALISNGWITDSEITYSFVFQDTNEDGFTPDPSTGSTGDFDSVTGTFVADDVDGEYVASGGVGYGTIEPFTARGTHHPFGYWVRFELRSTSGDYLYRYGQTQQHIEFFRATKGNGNYAALYLLAHATGTQTIGYRATDGNVFDTGYKVFGANKQSTSNKVRIEVGQNGITIDGINFTAGAFSETFLSTDPDLYFTKFDFGIITYPDDGSAAIDLDPEWNLRYSDIKIHDNIDVGTLGPADPNNLEITNLTGWTYGELIQAVLNSGNPAFNVIAATNLPAVIPSIGDYDGYSLDCSVTATGGDNNRGKGWEWTGAVGFSSPTVQFPYQSPPCDTIYPGMSCRFVVTDMPLSGMIQIISLENRESPTTSNWVNAGIYLDANGVLYASPDKNTPPIAFCTTEEGRYNYIEVLFDPIKYKKPMLKVWLDDVFMGEFISTTTTEAFYGNIFKVYKVGRLGTHPVTTNGNNSAIKCSIHFRDVAFTRCKHHRPLGPTVIIPRIITQTGEHYYPDPDTFTPDVSNVANNSDFSGGVDSAGQPHYWSGWDRHDTGTPSGAMKLQYLFQTFGDSTVSLTTDGSGPPGLEGANALQITAITQDGAGIETYSEAAYIPGGATVPEVDLKLTVPGGATLSAQFWLKGIAGQHIKLNAKPSGDGFNTHVMTGSWEYVKLYLSPGGGDYTAILLSFPDSSPGDIFLVKDFKLYVNAENNPPNFWQTEDNGSTTTRVPFEDTDSWELISDFPPDGNTQVYMNTDILSRYVVKDETNGDTDLPRLFKDYYLEYGFADAADAEKRVFGARLLTRIKGYNGVNTFDESVDFENFALSGRINLVMADEDGNYRFAGQFFSKGNSSDPNETYHVINLPRPPGLGEWTLSKWTDALLRIGFHDDTFANSFWTIGDYTNAGVIEGVQAEILMFDRRLGPPLCVRPVDLSRIRFRAFEQNDIED